jgi:hypothetical protein
VIVFCVTCACRLRRVVVNGALLCIVCDSVEKVPNGAEAVVLPDSVKHVSPLNGGDHA